MCPELEVPDMNRTHGTQSFCILGSVAFDNVHWPSHASVGPRVVRDWDRDCGCSELHFSGVVAFVFGWCLFRVSPAIC